MEELKANHAKSTKRLIQIGRLVSEGKPIEFIGGEVYVPERTCYAEADYIYCEGMEDEIYWNDKCSECHEHMGEPIPNYCPHCGARVIDY